MNDRTLVAAVVAVLVIAATGPAAATALDSTPVADRPAAQTNETGNASLGASLSGFMQASAADAEGEVDDGVFRARAMNASNETRRELVTERIEELEQRLERLRERRQALLEKDGDLTPAERARAARLAAEVRSLQDAIDTTEEVAVAAGINQSMLDRLRQNASELSGPEVAAIAGEVADPPAANQSDEAGPPTEVPDGVTATPTSPDRNETDTTQGTEAETGNGDNPADGGSAGNGNSDSGQNDAPTPTETEDGDRSGDSNNNSNR